MQFIALALLSTAILNSPFWIIAKVKKQFSLFNFLCPFTPVIFWFLLTASGFGAQSISNIIEIPILNILTVSVCTVLIFVQPDLLLSKKKRYLILSAFIVLTFLLRAFMPVIPE